MYRITNPISNIPLNEKSHVRGWTTIWANQLDAAINHRCTPEILKSNTVYIDHGVNFGGTLNLFGGATKEIFDRINLVMACKKIVSLDWDMPDYGAMLKKRIGAKTTYSGITEQWCDSVSARIATIPGLKQEDLATNNVTVGDSHTIAFSAQGDKVYRNDGLTLHGALKRGLKTLLRNKPIDGRITFCLGSIDIRHHMLRHEIDLHKMITEYVRQGNECSDNDVFYTAPVPVEFEERRIPQSGFYKKTAFFGTLSERKDLTNKFIDILDSVSNGKIISPPTNWYSMNPELYAKTYMEHGSSFHIAPPFYYNNDWGKTSIEDAFA
tara:strand:- start:795 stop:1766 length:972 start_codon:yes stop_codon:yes gene_type:complete